MTKLLIVRGLPGSGKSTLAKKLVSVNPGSVHIEADMFFTGKDGYKFDPSKIKEAHEWCFNTTKIFLSNGVDVVVSNTFTQRWEVQKYTDVADELGITYGIIVATGDFGSVHNVPQETIDKMRQRWEEI